MISQERLATLAGQPVYAAEGVSVGTVVHLLLDDTTGRPEWALVRSDSSGFGERFVPLRDAIAAPDRLLVPFTSAKIAAAPPVTRQSLSVADEKQLFAYFGVEDAREEVHAEAGAGWSPMDRAQAIRAGTDGAESSRSRLRVFNGHSV